MSLLLLLKGSAASSGLVLLLENEMRQIKKGSTDQSVVIRIVDSTTFLPETAVEHDTSGIDLWYRREGATKTSITEATLAALDSAHSDGGLEAIGDGYYRLDLPDAAVATGANGVAVGGTVTGMVVIGCYVHLVDYDPQADPWTTALTEAYRSAGATGTPAQLLYEILQNLTEFAISGTTKTVKKLDASTTAKTYTLDSATVPTSITETT